MFLGKYAYDSIGVIQCDCDGQHHINDINRCAELLRRNPDKFILGVRNFKDKNIPLRSRFGNNCTNLVFKLFCGLNISDTQTGLKGIPTSFIPELMETPGERFEYASSVLLETKKAGVEIVQFPIRTIYINGNATSHFNPVTDSIRIYSLIFKYLASSLTATVIDLVFFSIFSYLLRGTQFQILAASLLSKIFCCTYNFVVNKRFVFQSDGNVGIEAVKYIVLSIAHAVASSSLIILLTSFIKIPNVIAKMIVDTALFFVVYHLQNVWVFKKRERRNGNKD